MRRLWSHAPGKPVDFGGLPPLPDGWSVWPLGEWYQAEYEVRGPGGFRHRMTGDTEAYGYAKRKGRRP